MLSTIKQKWEARTEELTNPVIEEPGHSVEFERNKVGPLLLGLIQESQKMEFLTHGYAFARLTTILQGTRWAKFIQGVTNCKSPETLRMYLYNVYLAVEDITKRGGKIKVKGQLKFEQEMGLKLKH